jgi:hypothetical protein
MDADVVAQAAWIPLQGAVRWMTLGQFAVSAFVFVLLFFIAAPYGRHFRKGWGLVMPTWSAWMLMEFPSLAVMLGFGILNMKTIGPVSIVLSLLWIAHYFYRSLVYPFLTGLRTRTFPVLLLFFAMIFNLNNAFINVNMLVTRPLPDVWFYDFRFIAGIVMFFAGFVLHAHSDLVLRRLRREGGRGYSIPREGFFRFVSSPNYLGEILEWTGFALASWSLAGLAFAVFTIANLAPRAFANHRWYKKTFAEYPAERKALIPGIL